MNEPDSQTSLQQVSAKIDEVVSGFKLMLIVFTLLASIPNFCGSLSIDHFAQIFSNALPGKPLPLLTLAVIGHSTLLIILTFIWPLLAILNVVYGKYLKIQIICGIVILALIGLQVFLTWIACFLPMGNLLAGMSDTGAH